MSAMAAAEEALLLLEKQLLQPDFRNSPERVAALLAEEFIEFGSSGQVYDKPGTIAALRPGGAGGNAESPRIEEFRARELAPALFLVNYRIAAPGGPGQIVAGSLRSSLWTWRDNRWQLLFHQGTPSTR